MSLTKNPMNPMMAKPIAVAMAIFWNSTTRFGKRDGARSRLFYLFDPVSCSVSRDGPNPWRNPSSVEPTCEPDPF